MTKIGPSPLPYLQNRMTNVSAQSRRFPLSVSLALAILALLALIAPAARAQTQATELANLAVELWPDYDRPEMLVLLTGTLPESVALPAAVALPVPEGAEVNAVARFNDSGVLVSDVQYEVDGDRLLFTTPGSRFRVEYYTPYQSDGSQRSFTFNWLSDVAVDEFTTVVQQPSGATDLSTNPEAVSATAERGDGLTYHTLPTTSLVSGQPYSVDLNYTNTASELSATSIQPPAAVATTSTTSSSAPSSSGGFLDGVNPWLLLGLFGLLALVGAGAWYLGTRQTAQASKPRKPTPERPAKTSNGGSTAKPAGQARFCHNCGTQARPGDTFCRSCGTQLKG